MSDNSSFVFGIDLYEGNEIKDWKIVQDWGVQFCYFRLGIGVHVDKQVNMLACANKTALHMGGYYQVWLPDVSVARQCQAIQDALDKFNSIHPERLDLPLALAFEPETNPTTHVKQFPRWLDTLAIKDHFEALRYQVVIYTSLSGLDELIRQGFGSLANFNWWIARYNFNQDVTGEMSVENTLTLLQQTYHIPVEKILFMQTMSQGVYPPGAAVEKEADYDRAVSWVFADVSPSGDVPPILDADPEEDTPNDLEVLIQSFDMVNAKNGLNIRDGAGLDHPVVGWLVNPSRVQGVDLGNGWVELHGYVSAFYLKVVGEVVPPDPQPDPEPIPDPVPSSQLMILRGDEELADFGYKSRTAGLSYAWTPSVFRFEKTARPPKSDYRVDISPMYGAISALNGADKKTLEYLYSDKTALFNNTGKPKQAYITMSGNKFEVIEIAGGYLKFKTLKPSSNVSGMTWQTHPQFVHRFDLVGWVDKTTRHKAVIKPEIPVIYYYLVTKEGFGYIPIDKVRKA